LEMLFVPWSFPAWRIGTSQLGAQDAKLFA
jgi:hypothetical protein